MRYGQGVSSSVLSSYSSASVGHKDSDVNIGETGDVSHFSARVLGIPALSTQSTAPGPALLS